MPLLACFAVFSLRGGQQSLSRRQAPDSMEAHYPSLLLKQSLAKAAVAHITEVRTERPPAQRLMDQLAGGVDSCGK